MSTSVELLEPRKPWAPPETKPLDQAVWQTCEAKGRAQDRRNNAAFLKGVNCITIAGLLVAAGFWSHIAPFDLPVRFIVAAGAMIAMFHAFHTRHFVFAAVFAAVAVLYNPVAPVLSFSGDWQRAVVVASALPFIVSFRLAQFEDRTP